MPPAAEDREWALRRALQQINVEIEKASRNSVAIWFPMGNSNLRVVRLAPRESRLLNSRCGAGGAAGRWRQQMWVAAAEAEGVPGCLQDGEAASLRVCLTCGAGTSH